MHFGKHADAPVLVFPLGQAVAAGAGRRQQADLLALRQGALHDLGFRALFDVHRHDEARERHGAAQRKDDQHLRRLLGARGGQLAGRGLHFLGGVGHLELAFARRQHLDLLVVVLSAHGVEDFLVSHRAAFERSAGGARPGARGRRPLP